ncbi:MAG: DNA-directed RNA polymerase subunit alpha [Deltaproteobacteria bacterium]|nr:DNA-directed RNA polymerase subunit alpha [Deltaproteobacteria bacterium]MCX7953335.1 DNA-directed RNA polymerase subunit alpha [Deltaproteobacteria bacterium]
MDRKRVVYFSNFIMPKRPVIDTLDSRYGKFILEPLERGFGITLGNALRRVLLSGIQGTAITSVKINNVHHEFSPIPGVLEDVVTIILNLKEVVLAFDEKEEVHLKIDQKGPYIVKAGDIKGDPCVTVVNPEKQICTLSDGVEFKAELTARVGRGYVPAENLRVEGVPIGTIFLDAVFSPVRKVNFTVLDARVGQKTDYDKLVLEIWTDGSVDPKTALYEAAEVLKRNLNLFASDEVVQVKEQVIEPEQPKQVLNEVLLRRIDELELSVRSSNCLESLGIKYVGELVQLTEAQLLRTKNFGRKSLNEIKERLSEMGLALGMNLPSFPTRKELDQMYRAMHT